MFLQKLSFKVHLKEIIGIFFFVSVPVAGTILTKAPMVWPVSVSIYSIGLIWWFERAANKKNAIVFYCLFSSALFINEAAFFSSYYIQNKGFNEAFFYNLRPDIFYAGISEYYGEIFIVVSCLTISLVLCSTNLLHANQKRCRSLIIALFVFFVGIGLSPSTRSLAVYAKNSFQGPPGDIYAQFPELRNQKISVSFSGSKRPNVVMIYAESFGSRYFDEEKFPSLVPNIKALKEQSISFSNVVQGVGADWTIAGIVASQCGYPLTAFSDDFTSNITGEDLSLFKDFLPKARCLGDVLKEDGYRLTFIGGADIRYSGKDRFLSSHGYSELIGREEIMASTSDKTYKNHWGAYDDTLFDFSFDKFIELNEKSIPFFMTILTLDTHHPYGFLSKSCGLYGQGENSSLNSVHCSDFLITNFVHKIRSSDFSEDTIIVILSDHTVLKNRASILLESSRLADNLLLFVNTPNGENINNTNRGIHYDIAPTILDLLEYDIQGQMGFGQSLLRGPGYLPERFGEQEWVNHSKTILAISKNLWADKKIILDRKGIELSVKKISLIMGDEEVNLRSMGFLEKQPMSSLFLFDENSLELAEVKLYPLDRGLAPKVIGEALLKNKEKLGLAITQAKNLPVFTAPNANPKQWWFFMGKAGSDKFSRGPIKGNLKIPYELITQLAKAEIDDKTFLARQNQMDLLPDTKVKNREEY